MAATKVKLKDLGSDREYLLLASKMNLKGVLVETTRELPAGARVDLSIHLDDGRAPVRVLGEVHRVALRPGGGRGVILRFLDPEPGAISRIEAHLRKAMKLPEPTNPEYAAREKTMLMDLNTLSRLSVSGPAEGGAPAAFSVDEEALAARHAGLAGETRIAAAAEISPARAGPARRILPPKWLVGLGLLLAGGLTFLILSAALLRYLDRTFGLKPPTELEEAGAPAPRAPEAKGEPAEKEAAPAPAPARPAPAAPKPAAPRITEVEVEKGEAFVKVVVRGRGDFSKHSAVRAMSPRRLLVDFPAIPATTAPESLSVTENPLLRIRTEKREGGVRLILDLYPVPFPRYEVKPRPEGAEIFLWR